MNESQEFFDFVKTQPADQAINHHGGWCDCAVGEFTIDAYGKTSVGEEHSYAYEPLLADLSEHHGIIYEALNDPNNNDLTPQTYGELADLITRYEGKPYNYADDDYQGVNL